MTLYLQTLEGAEAPDKIDHSVWRPWINCKTMDEAICMALRRHVRDRGGVLPTEELVVVRVLCVPEADMVRTSGKPQSAHCIVFNVIPE